MLLMFPGVGIAGIPGVLLRVGVDLHQRCICAAIRPGWIGRKRSRWRHTVAGGLRPGSVFAGIDRWSAGAGGGVIDSVTGEGRRGGSVGITRCRSSVAACGVGDDGGGKCYVGKPMSEVFGVGQRAGEKGRHYRLCRMRPDWDRSTASSRRHFERDCSIRWSRAVPPAPSFPAHPLPTAPTSNSVHSRPASGRKHRCRSSSSFRGRPPCSPRCRPATAVRDWPEAN